MTKKDIAEYIIQKFNDELNLSKKEVYEIVSEVFKIIEETLKSGEKVQITGFGTFLVKHRKAKKGRNPKTGEEVPVPDRYVIVFKPSRKLLDFIKLRIEKYNNNRDGV